MNHRDLILASVFLNAALFALFLFISDSPSTASSTSPKKIAPSALDGERRPASSTASVGRQPPPQQSTMNQLVRGAPPAKSTPLPVAFIPPSVGEEEMDKIMRELHESAPVAYVREGELAVRTTAPSKSDPTKSEVRSDPKETLSQQKGSQKGGQIAGTAPASDLQQAMRQQPSPSIEWTEIIIKRGDALEKIARAHRVSVSDLKKFNGLTSERLSIGQRIRVPSVSPPPAAALPPPASSQGAPSAKAVAIDLSSGVNNVLHPADILPPDFHPDKVSPHGEREDSLKRGRVIDEQPLKELSGEYYVIRSGDSLWTIARERGLSYQELLRLNQLDENSAKNLKVGTTIRLR